MLNEMQKGTGQNARMQARMLNNHVGIGSDFNGGGGLEDGFDISEIGNITLELVKRVKNFAWNLFFSNTKNRSW
jgi:microsomal dipeptidase-like Zn-dependent dipeptidase